MPRTSWGDAPAAVELFGREDDLAYLDAELAAGARVLALTGAGGLGKSSLARVWAENRGSTFDTIFWRGFKNRIELSTALHELRQFALPEAVAPPRTLAEQLEEVTELLRTQRLLVVLDNLESVMDARDVGAFVTEYAEIETLCNRVVERAGDGVLLLTAREIPRVVTRLVRQTRHMAHRPLEGLQELSDRRALVTGLGFPDASDRDVTAFATYHDGNPYAMGVAADFITRRFEAARLHGYVEAGCPLPSETTALLADQYGRLSEAERAVLMHMAVARTSLTTDELVSALTFRYSTAELTAAVGALDRRSLLEPPTAEGQTLQNLLAEFLTERLVADLADAIETAEVGDALATLLIVVPICSPGAAPHVRTAQSRVISEPLLTQLVLRWGPGSTVAERLLGLLDGFRGRPRNELGYAPGTVLNLLVHSRASLEGRSFCDLPLWSCDLTSAELQNVDMTGSDLRGSAVRSVFAGVLSLCFDSAGAHIYAGTTDGLVHVWDVSSWERRSVRAHEGFVRGVAFDEGTNRVLSVGEDHQVRAWGPQLQALTPVANASERLHCVAVHPESGAVAYGGASGFAEVRMGGVVRTVSGHTGTVRGLLFHGHRLVSVCEDGHVVETPLDEPESPPRSLSIAYHPWCITDIGANRVAVAGREGQPVIIDTADFSKIDELLPTVGAPIWQLSLVDGALAACTSAGTLVFFDLGRGYVDQTILLHGNWARALASSSRRGLIATGGEDHRIHVVRSADRSVVHSMEGAAQTLWAARPLADDSVVAGGGDGVLHVWSGTERSVVPLSTSRRWIRAVAVSRDLSRVAVAGDGGDIYLWDITNGVVRFLGTHGGGHVWSIDFHPTQPYVATAGEDRTVRLWRLQPGTESEIVVHEHESWVVSVRFDETGTRIASGADDGRILVSGWDGREPLTALSDPESHQPWALGWHGSSVISGGRDGWVRQWALDAPTTPIATYDWRAPIWSIAVNGDDVFVTGDGGKVSRLHARDLTKSGTDSRTGNARNHDIAVTPNGTTLVLASDDGAVYELPRDGGDAVQRTPLKQYEGLRLSREAGLSAQDMASVELLGAVITDKPVARNAAANGDGSDTATPTEEDAGSPIPPTEAEVAGGKSSDANNLGLIVIVVVALLLVAVAIFAVVVVR